ncbi:hypothetical protein BDB00DRAFT_380188 [Zychaea mexicana]|uniref:uncharacterized protein n=1 Tax=Zychaea mexicana TaxID=64656 RepID=UPI0022FEBE21|nr:uncharacterized protein BDB00DRAFT_380188 [Zychaea mexicana]KAI9493224.1 hypothetical protein BDB00DRAFT_380188 [Zychaea mexicana]
MANIDGFLDSVKERVSTVSDNQNVVIVTGNDSADLDSIISALLFAYISNQQSPDVLYIPLVKVPLADLELRPEVGFVLESAGVNYKKLICIDHIGLPALYDANARVFLVDHNRLTAPFDENKWRERVNGVLDHHVDENQYTDTPIRIITTVGSCTTLVVLQFPGIFSNDKTLSQLAVGPILVDTIGLRWDFGKTTETDEKAYDIVRKLASPSLTYDAIEQVKSRIQHLCTRDLLRKDYKEWVVDGYRVGTSSLSWNFQGWIDRDGAEDIVQKTQEYINERQLDMEVILTGYNGEDGLYRRELALFVSHTALLLVKATLESDDSVGLKQFPFINAQSSSGVAFYSQGNVKLSRKQIWPLVQSIIEQKVEAKI